MAGGSRVSWIRQEEPHGVEEVQSCSEKARVPGEIHLDLLIRSRSLIPTRLHPSLR
ncbi:hypothetical protein SCLCIDRAFT_1220606 [Scleroderma citrinum Foug A]|uniref:Uncharacterized protein n=1 Tax=Scleroderma citrinum Foug A TaxID=1036808 RepID=A0A0C3DJ97_9AGAM|nr:hypothetical protein SCLCIDRAFT_1220606 [Scleroderma citrinum Foug A]